MILHTLLLKHFKTILDEILNEQPEFKLPEDINSLYDIAVNDSRFQDLNNLITYCPYCHYHIAHKETLFAENKHSELLENPSGTISSQADNLSEGSETI